MRFIGRSVFFAALAAALMLAFGGAASAETLLAHYEFNEAVGPQDTLADSAAAGGYHTLTQVKTAGTGEVVYDAERGGNVLYQPATSAYEMGQGNVGSFDFAAQTSITLAGWFKQTGVPTTTGLYTYALMLGYNSSEPICSLGFLSDYGNGSTVPYTRGAIVSYIETDYGDAVGTNNKDQMDIFTAPDTISLDANNAFDGWHHVAVVYDRTLDVATIYLDGVAQQTTARENTSKVLHTDGSVAYLSDTHGLSFDGRDSNDTTKTGPGSVGYYTTTSNFRGYMDDLRIYNGALTAGQIAGLVPEPGTFALILCGALGLLVFRKRK